MKDKFIMPQDDEHDSLSTSCSTASNHSHAQASGSPPTTITTAPPRIILSSSPRTIRGAARAVPNHTPATAVRIAIDMRTRSSRLFFVLLHLVGVSTNVPSGSRSNSAPSDKKTPYYYTDIFSFLRQHHPSWLTWSTGIVGVHPTAILLERLHVESSRLGLKGILERVERVWGWDGIGDLLGEPYWFQDNTDGQCLGPGGGFSECGDATLWRVRRRPLTKRQLREKRYTRHRQRLQEKRESQQNEKLEQEQPKSQKRSSSSSSVCVWPFFCEDDSQFLQSTQTDYDEVYGFEYENYDKEEEGFALQLMDLDAMIATNSGIKLPAGLEEGSRRRHKRRLFWNFNNNQEAHDEDECLLSFPSAKNGVSTSLQIGSCSSEEAWLWHVNRDGILVRGSTDAEKRRRKRRWFPKRRASTAALSDGSSGSKLLHSSQADFGCVHRADSTVAMMLPCDGAAKKQEVGGDASLVGFSLVRFPSPSSKNAPRQQLDDADPVWEPWITLEGPNTVSADEKSRIAATNAEDKEAGAKDPKQHLPSSRTSSQKHASAGAKHHKVDLKSTASMLHTSLEGKANKDAATSASHIRDAPIAMNGVSFHMQRMDKAGEKSDRGPKGPSIRLNKKSKVRKNVPRGQTPIHDNSSEARGGDHGPDSIPHPPRKIPVHPYIQSSKDFVWVDPLTSLEYPTDLGRYLGHTKKEAGRHTLMGVGQYYRTAFNIKVYGAALYVAKRDVLADPKFGEYATLSAEDLRSRGDFYEHLMNIPAPGEDPANSIGGFFDRTLFIKINMQLSTDAMRKSLESDWSLLTDEMKSLIIDSSFEERVADERMQKKIQSKENSSNCSCGQSAPEGIVNDPACCARGTELVFTWRKNSDFEVRLDGRLMDTFPRPDIARGIFSEYLNDNPISQDAKAHFTDGFPFLLAPLAQVKGMSSAVPQAQESVKEIKSPSSHNPMHRLMDFTMSSVGAVNTQAQTVSKWMQDGASEMSSSALGSAMGVARGLSEELDKQRMELLENAVDFHKDGMEMLSSFIKLPKEDDGSALTIVNDVMPSLSPFSAGFETYNRVDAPEIMPDEIGIKIEPKMNFTHTLFFTTVHIYLLLLLIVSIPGSNTTRLVVKRRILETKNFVQSQSHGAFAVMSKLH